MYSQKSLKIGHWLSKLFDAEEQYSMMTVLVLVVEAEFIAHEYSTICTYTWNNFRNTNNPCVSYECMFTPENLMVQLPNNRIFSR